MKQLRTFYRVINRFFLRTESSIELQMLTLAFRDRFSALLPLEVVDLAVKGLLCSVAIGSSTTQESVGMVITSGALSISSIF